MSEIRALHALNAQLGEVDAKAALEGAEHEAADIDRGRTRLENASAGALKAIEVIEQGERQSDRIKRHAEATALNAERVELAQQADKHVAALVSVLEKLSAITSRTKSLVTIRARSQMLGDELVQALITHGMNKYIALPRPARGRDASTYRSFEAWHRSAAGWVTGAMRTETEEAEGADGHGVQQAA